MTVQEAEKILDMFLHKQCDLERTKFAYEQAEVWHAVKIARGALKKQIPKKLKPYKGFVGECCNCGVVFLDKNTNYCGNCGQRLDWSEEE